MGRPRVNYIVSVLDYIRKGIAHFVSILGISFIESIILIICLFGSIVVIASELEEVWQGKLMVFILSFISSWLMSKISSNRELKEEQKKFAIVSYRHGKNLSTKMDLSVEKYNCIKSEKCLSKESCLYYQNMSEIIEDILIFKNDTEENIEDLSRYISEDIIKLDDIEEYDNKLKELNSKLQDENYYDRIDSIKSEIESIKIIRDQEFENINEELKVHYIKRNKRNQDLEKIVKNKKDRIESLESNKIISSKIASNFKDKIQIMIEGNN